MAVKREILANRRELGARIRAYREAKGLQQSELGEKIDVDQATISRWETGKSPMGVDEMIAVADALEIPVADLWRTKRPPKRSGGQQSG